MCIRDRLNAALQAPQSELFSIGRITDFPENVDYYEIGRAHV